MEAGQNMTLINDMTDHIDVEIDEDTLKQGVLYGLVKKLDGVYCMTDEGNEMLSEYLDEQLEAMPTCPKCERKAMLDWDYICRECRWGPRVDEVLITGT